MLWLTKRDDSLRGNNKLECVTYPLSGDSLLLALHYYTENARNYDDPFSWRCSTHFHFNLMDLEPRQVAALQLVGFAADNYLYAAGSEARRENYNCRPLSLLWPTAELLGTTARHFQRGHARKAVELLGTIRGEAPNRYVGMNWHSLPTFGTLELRHFPASRDLAQLVRWVNIGQRLIETAKTKSLDEVHTLIQQGPDRFGQTVFQDYWSRLEYDGHADDWNESLEGVEYFMTCVRHSTDAPSSLDGVLRRNMVIQ
jgi:hypothetical protein